MKLTKRTIFITGGTSGIGLEMARQLLGRGNTVIVTGRDQDALDAAARTLPGVHTFKSDVSNPHAITALHEVVLARFPELDSLVNNAGIMCNIRLADDRSLQDVTREIEVNFSGPVRMIQQFLPHLTTRPGALIVTSRPAWPLCPFQQRRSIAPPSRDALLHAILARAASWNGHSRDRAGASRR